MGIGRDLLEQMALAGSSRAEFDQVIVPFDERNHAQQRNPSGTFIDCAGFQSDRAQQKFYPLFFREGAATPEVDVQNVRLRHLDRPNPFGLERSSAFLLRYNPVVGKRDFGKEAACQHSLILGHYIIVDAHVPQVQTWEFRQVAVVPGV